MSTEQRPTIDDARGDARHRLTEPRLVVEYFFGGALHVLDLPGAEHIHVTVDRATGKVTAVAMDLHGYVMRGGTRLSPRMLDIDDVLLWRDVEGGGA